MEENKKPPYRRQILDDLFDAYVILGKGTYVSLYDTIGQMTRYSPASVDLFGLIGEYVPAGAMNWSDWVHPEDRRRYETIMSKLIAGTAKHYDLHYRVKLKDGTYSLMRFVGSILRNETTGKPELIGGITINEGLMEYTDPITVLRNQYGFFQDIKAVIELKKQCTLLMIGINKMSMINETQGYSYGNRLLQQIGWLMQETLSLDGTIYRLEGAKFGFLTENLTAEEVADKYEVIRQALLNGIPVDKVKQNLLSSGGMMTLDGSRKMGSNVDERAVYSFLSYTCHESKIHKNGRLVNFNGSFNRDTQESLEIIDKIRNNVLLDCKGFSLEYQISVDAKTEELTGVESFVKWTDEHFGEVKAEDFLPVLERDFVFEELGYWILQQAMSDGKKFLEKVPNLVVGVIVTQVQLEDEFFIEELQKIAKQTGFPLNHMCLGLTRSCRLLDMDFIKNIIAAFKDIGVKFMINDFGSGLASIDFLRELVPDYIKFDAKYTAAFNEERNRQVIRCLSELAASVGTKVCVTGVANQKIRDVLRQYPVDQLQGNYYAPFLKAETFLSSSFLVKGTGNRDEG